VRLRAELGLSPAALARRIAVAGTPVVFWIRVNALQRRAVSLTGR
jgi:hypothetical protein